MSDLLKRDFGDPLEVLLRRESERCRGCAHEFKAQGFGVVVWVCKEFDDAGRRRKHGSRCKDFEEK